MELMVLVEHRDQVVLVVYLAVVARVVHQALLEQMAMLEVLVLRVQAAVQVPVGRMELQGLVEHPVQVGPAELQGHLVLQELLAAAVLQVLVVQVVPMERPVLAVPVVRQERVARQALAAPAVHQGLAEPVVERSTVLNTILMT
jgi:hypothetical protein